MQQYFVKGHVQIQEVLSLDMEQLHHIQHVMRMKAGDQIRLVDEAKQAFLGTLCIQDQEMKVQVVDALPSITGKVSITLALALIKKERWDIAIQKCSELGVSKIQPLITSRCVVKVKPQELTKKVARWNKIALEACEQCHRSDLVEVLPPCTLDDILSQQADLKLLAYEHADHQSDQLLKILEKDRAVKDILCVVGPEGGLSEQEAQALLANDFHCTSLGPRILRAETAAMAIVNLLSSYYES